MSGTATNTADPPTAGRGYVSEAVESYFEEIAHRYDETFAPSYRQTADDLAGLLATLRPGDVVVDLGCGTGRAWPHLVAAGARVIGVDFSSGMFAQASRRASVNSVTRVRADLYAQWPLVDGRADSLIALHGVFAHPPSDPRACWARIGAELRRVGRRGASIAIDVPDPAWVARHLEHVDGASYRYRDAAGRSLEVIAEEPAIVVAALGVPLTVAPSRLGLRLFGQLG